MTKSTKLEKKLLKNYPSRFSDLTTENKRTCKNFSIKKFTSPSKLITLNTDPLSLIYG